MGGGVNEDALLALLKEHRVEAHRRLFAIVDELDHDQFRWQPRPSVPSIAFHVWHLGRWADFDREATGGGTQIWTSEGLAAVWGLAPPRLGVGETGMGMGDEMTPALARVATDRIQEYAFRAIKAFDDHVASLTAADLARNTPGPAGDTRDIGGLLLNHFAHDNRHLGMIEALRGVQGLSGTATD
jgi:hypothetical protein